MDRARPRLHKRRIREGKRRRDVWTSHHRAEDSGRWRRDGLRKRSVYVSYVLSMDESLSEASGAPAQRLSEPPVEGASEGEGDHTAPRVEAAPTPETQTEASGVEPSANGSGAAELPSADTSPGPLEEAVFPSLIQPTAVLDP